MRWAALLCVVGCGRIGFDVPAVSGDAARDSITIDSPPPPSPLAYWRLEEGTGTMTTDAVASISGQLTAGVGVAPTWIATSVPRPAGFAVKFVGDGDRVQLGTPALLNNIPALTVAGWVNTTSILDDGNAHCLFDKGLLNSGGWAALMNMAGDASLSFEAFFGATIMSAATAPNAIAANTWTHIAYTWDGSASGAGVHFYVDGVEVAVISTTDGTGARPSDSTIGAAINCISSNSTPGQFDDVIIFDRVLTPAQIAQLYGS